MRILNQTEEVKNIFLRTRKLVWVIMFSFFLLFGRVFYLQVVKGNDLTEKSRDNFILSEKIFPARGDILSYDDQLLATTQPSFKISIVPLFFAEKEMMSEQIDRISSVLELNKNEAARLRKNMDECYGRCKYMPMLVKDEIPRKRIFKYSSYLSNFPGTIISSSYKRLFPLGETASHITGYVSKINYRELEQFTDYDPEDFTGKTGLEKEYEKELHGQYGETFHVIDHMGRKIELPENVNADIPLSKEAVKGKDLRTTILSYVQKTAATAFGERAGATLLMEIKTGRVLAMYSSPSYDANLLSRKRIPAKIWREYSQSILKPLINKAIRQTYFPGSTFKVIPALAGLHYGAITPKSTFLCQGCLYFGTDTKCCWNRGGHGHVNLRRSLKESCDIYYYYLSQELGLEKMTHFSSLFGIGLETGIDLPWENSGILPDRAWFSYNYPGMRVHRGILMNLSIGQGDIRMTPLQLAVAYAAIANDGIIVQPRIVEELISPDGKIEKINSKTVRVLDIDKKHLKTVRKALWSVTNEPGGTAFYHADRTIPDAAGKTGTSQVISNVARKKIDYSEEERRFLTQDDALFAAFFPYDDPQVVAVAIVENGGHGGSVAAPIVYKLLKSYHFKKALE